MPSASTTFPISRLPAQPERRPMLTKSWRAALAAVLAFSLTLTLACAQSSLSTKAAKGSRIAAKAARVIESYHLQNAEPIVARIDQASVALDTLSKAFASGASNSVELTAQAIEAFDEILTQLDVLPLKYQTLAKVALAVLDEVLHDIADELQ